jgi:hypothetical protein
MDTWVSALDFSAWLSWASYALYVASFCLALLLIVLVTCIVVQVVTAVGHSEALKTKDVPGPFHQSRGPGAGFLRRIRNLG